MMPPVWPWATSPPVLFSVIARMYLGPGWALDVLGTIDNWRMDGANGKQDCHAEDTVCSDPKTSQSQRWFSCFPKAADSQPALPLASWSISLQSPSQSEFQMLSVSLKKILLKDIQSSGCWSQPQLDQQDFQVCLQTLMKSDANCLTFNKLTNPAKCSEPEEFSSS